MEAIMSSKIASFEQLQQLGEGAAGEVYLSVLKEPKPYAGVGDLIALKLYKQADQEQLKRIEIETQVGTQISHPNIVRIFEGSPEPKEPFIVMEYVDGITLENWIRMFFPIPDEWVHTVFTQIISGLAELHHKGITHRDIKPENIMLTSDFNVKIMDLGVIQIPRKPGISPPGKLLGTIRNSSPDVLKGQEYEYVDDIYSLGTVAYSFLHGEQVFADEDNELALIQKITHEDIYYADESIRNRSKFCAEFLQLVKRILNKHRKSRPQAVEKVKERLIKFQDYLTVPHPKPIHGYIASSLTSLGNDARQVVAFASKTVAEVCKSYNIYAHQPRKATDPILRAKKGVLFR
jgi:serine/threonine-protein kinase